MNPYQLAILLHYYVSPQEFAQADSPAFAMTVRDFVDVGMLAPREDRQYGGSWQTTDRANVWIKHVLATPFPEQHWIVPLRAREVP